MSFQKEINRLAGTDGLETQRAANVLAGTTGKELLYAPKMQIFLLMILNLGQLQLAVLIQQFALLAKALPMALPILMAVA
jgi:hypothetical protein